MEVGLPVLSVHSTECNNKELWHSTTTRVIVSNDYSWSRQGGSGIGIPGKPYPLPKLKASQPCPKTTTLCPSVCLCESQVRGFVYTRSKSGSVYFYTAIATVDHRKCPVFTLSAHYTHFANELITQFPSASRIKLLIRVCRNEGGCPLFSSTEKLSRRKRHCFLNSRK